MLVPYFVLRDCWRLLPSFICTKAKSVQGWNTADISGQEHRSNLFLAWTKYKAVFGTLSGTACFPPYNPCLIDAMLPVLPCFTDTTTAGAPMSFRRWFLHAKRLLETQGFLQMSILIFLRLKHQSKTFICKVSFQEQQLFGIRSILTAFQNTMTLSLLREGSTSHSFLSK